MKKIKCMVAFLLLIVVLTSCGNAGSLLSTDSGNSQTPASAQSSGNSATGDLSGSTTVPEGSTSVSNGTSGETSEVSDEEIVDSFREYIYKSEYLKAVELYDQAMIGSASLEQAAVDVMTAHMENTLSAVLSGECAESEAKVRMKTVENVCSKTGCKIDKYSELSLSIEQAFASKVAYKSGVALYEQGLYKEAIAEFNKVLPEDSDYSSAQEKLLSAKENYKNATKASADALIAQSDYIGAIDVYKKAVKEFPEDSDIPVWLKVTETAYISKTISDSEAVFTDYTMYQEALAVINAAI